jgi:hypothetical protein
MGDRHNDSAFALPKVFRLLEKEGFRSATRLKANAVLERKIAHLLARPVGPLSDIAGAAAATESERLRRASAVRKAGRFRGLRAREEPTAVSPDPRREGFGAHPSEKIVDPASSSV